MRMKKAAFVVLFVGVAVALDSGLYAAQPDKGENSNWREEYAYTLGVQAYTFGFPWVYLPEIRWQWVTQPRNPKWVPYAALNHFWHSAQLTNAEYRDGGSPNNDTMYSVAWLDVRKEPVILSHPDMGERYFTFEIAGMSSDNFAYAGKRTTGSKAGNFAIIGPGWKGDLPEGVKPLPASPTPFVLILGRTLVDGPADVANVHKLQEGYRLTPLSLWGKPDAKVAEDRDVWKPFDAKIDPLADWKTMNKAMTDNPPADSHALLLKMFATIGVGPKQDVDKMDEATKRGLARAAKDGRKLLGEMLKAGETSKRVNGWSYPPPTLGRAGLGDDFVTRGAIQCLGGIVANDPAEAVYLNTFTDFAGKKLSGENHYLLHFNKGDFPKVEAFWSMTMYDLTYNLVDNPIHRFSIGNRTKELKFDADGGLTLYIQDDSPGKESESNWLPSPKGDFYLILRAYIPSEGIVEQTWAPPAVKRAD
jgi:hypothetical protein